MESTQSNPDARFVSTASLRERSTCVACGSHEWRVVWSDRFDSPSLCQWWDRYGYEADIGRALAGEAFELVECRHCSMRYQRWVLVDDDLRRLYSEWISPAQTRHWEAISSQGRDAEHQFDAGRRSVAHLLDLDRRLGRRDRDGRPIRLVDFGCGDGGFVRLARSFGFDAVGVDFSETRHEQATTGGIEIAGSLEELRRSGVDTVDVVTMFEVLEHLADPVGALRAVSEMLEPGGILLIEVPDCGGIDEPRGMAEFNCLNPLEHVNAFTPATLVDLCSRVGFVPLRRRPTVVSASPIGVARAIAGAARNRPSTRRAFCWSHGTAG